jgi:hypothetical protein
MPSPKIVDAGVRLRFLYGQEENAGRQVFMLLPGHSITPAARSAMPE